MFSTLNACHASDKYGRISRESLKEAEMLVTNEKVAVSLYIFPHAFCRFPGCIRKSVLSYPENPIFKERVSFQEWAQFTLPLMYGLDDDLPVCNFAWYLLEPCICLLHCPITRGSYKKPDSIRELNAFYEFLDEINSKLLNFRNMEARLLVTEAPLPQNTACESTYPGIPEQQLRIIIHIFNSATELKAFPRPKIGVTPGYPHAGELLCCLWTPFPDVCCLPRLDYKLHEHDCPVRVPDYQYRENSVSTDCYEACTVVSAMHFNSTPSSSPTFSHQNACIEENGHVQSAVQYQADCA